MSECIYKFLEEQFLCFSLQKHRVQRIICNKQFPPGLHFQICKHCYEADNLSGSTSFTCNSAILCNCLCMRRYVNTRRYLSYIQLHVARLAVQFNCTSAVLQTFFSMHAASVFFQHYYNYAIIVTICTNVINSLNHAILYFKLKVHNFFSNNQFKRILSAWWHNYYAVHVENIITDIFYGVIV